MKLPYLVFFLFLLMFSCHPGRGGKIGDDKPLTFADQLKERKSNIDAISVHHQNKALAFAKVAGSNEMILVKDEAWPNNIEYTCNILKSEANQVIMIVYSPFNGNGDEDLSYTHYFDEQGKTFAFEKQASFTNSNCNVAHTGTIYETTSSYFDPHFKVITRGYELTDAKGKTLAGSNCGFNNQSTDMKPNATLQASLAEYHIPASQVTGN